MKERLFRSKEKRVFGGVAGGLSEYLNVDPVLIRVIFVIITFINGLGLLLYIILWIVVPEYNLESKKEPEVKSNYSEPPSSSTTEQKTTVKKSNGNGRVVVGLILIGLGIVFLLERVFPYFDFIDLMPIILVAVGGTLVWNTLKK